MQFSFCFGRVVFRGASHILSLNLPSKYMLDFKLFGGNKQILSFLQVLTVIIYKPKPMQLGKHVTPAAVLLKHPGLHLIGFCSWEFKMD